MLWLGCRACGAWGNSMSQYDTAQVFINTGDTRVNASDNYGVGTFRDEHGQILEHRLEHVRVTGYDHEGSAEQETYASIDDLLADSGDESTPAEKYDSIEELLADSGDESTLANKYDSIEELLADSGDESNPAEQLDSIEELLADSGDEVADAT